MTPFFILVVILLHLGFALLEIFFWTKPFGRKVFKLSPSFAEESRLLAMNQGLYNLILAAGLLFTFFIGEPSFQYQARLFFLLSIVFAGLFGGVTVKRSILYVQALPALIALITMQT